MILGLWFGRVIAKARYVKNEKGCGSFRGVEKVVGGVGDAKLLANVGCVAAGGWRFATFGVEALDCRSAREDTGAVMAEDIDQEPRNGIRVGRGRIGNGLAGDAAAVGRFPRGSGEMFAEGLAIFIEELGIGG